MSGEFSRREALRVGAVAGAAVPLLAACGSGNSSAIDSTSATPGATLGTTGDIPVGSGTIFKAESVVVTQPSAGTFKCFSAVCTHQGCLVSNVSSTINCTCHGSQFSITDGSVVNGPASQPLPAKQITVSGNDITLA